eukprot:3401253-Pyramimonas_sp.AAC.1
MVHFNGEQCSVVKRGRFNAMKPEAETQRLPFHARMCDPCVTQKSERATPRYNFILPVNSQWM